MRLERTPNMKAIFISLIFALFLSGNAFKFDLSGDGNKLSTYIIHVELPDDFLNVLSGDLKSLYKSFLPMSIASSDSVERIIHSYSNVLSGFAARLTPLEAEALKLIKGVLFAKEEEFLPLHTTHSPSFLGLKQNVMSKKDGNLGKGMIIGVLDTGVNPNHPSFSDEGLPPPPAKWKGRCDFNETGQCNNKIIGARDLIAPSYMKTPPFDEEGHGTHTASTAAGNFVKDANVFGMAEGTAAGMAPLAHLAIYKVCGGALLGCPESALLAAIDAAVSDGVDVISLSIGTSGKAYGSETLVQGAFAAMKKGIFVSCSAGNDGPSPGSVSNVAPWLLTVGASTLDRSFRATVWLGDGTRYEGQSLFQPQDSSRDLPLVYPGANGNISLAYCLTGSLSNSDVKDKIVLCDKGFNARFEKGKVVKEAGGSGMIILNDEIEGYSIPADFHVLPASHVSYEAGLRIKAYINSTSTPTARITFEGTVIGNSSAPAVATFSSRGPNHISPGILKPDIIGPGVNILAAWPNIPVNNMTTQFSLLSGTSMSCPHLSGIAALIKSAHPDWSPAAIKSAIMTTADVLTHKKKPILDNKTGLTANYFVTGAGHVSPTRANHPGLIYDILPEDYISYLCGMGYNDTTVSIITRSKVGCSQTTSIPEAQLNYPSFSIVFGASPQTYTRKVTNVGHANSSYRCKIKAPAGVKVNVSPRVISFSRKNQTATYTVTFIKNTNLTNGTDYSQGSLSWVSGRSFARSPIAVTFNGNPSSSKL